MEFEIVDQQRQRDEFLELAERFRSGTNEDEVKRLGEQLGGLIFGDLD